MSNQRPSGGETTGLFCPKLLGYSSIWQVYRSADGDVHLSVQLQDPGAFLLALRNGLAGLEAERLLRNVSQAARWHG